MNTLTTLQSYMVYPFVRYALIAGVLIALCCLSAGRYAGAETVLVHRRRAIPRRFRRNGCRNSGQRQQQYGHRHARDHHQRHFAFISKRCDRISAATRHSP